MEMRSARALPPPAPASRPTRWEPSLPSCVLRSCALCLPLYPLRPLSPLLAPCALPSTASLCTPAPISPRMLPPPGRRELRDFPTIFPPVPHTGWDPSRDPSLTSMGPLPHTSWDASLTSHGTPPSHLVGRLPHVPWDPSSHLAGRLPLDLLSLPHITWDPSLTLNLTLTHNHNHTLALQDPCLALHGHRTPHSHPMGTLPHTS